MERQDQFYDSMVLGLLTLTSFILQGGKGKRCIKLVYLTWMGH